MVSYEKQAPEIHCTVALLIRQCKLADTPSQPLHPSSTLGKDGSGQVREPSFSHKVIVVHHGIGRPKSGSLLSEVITKLQERGVFF